MVSRFTLIAVAALTLQPAFGGEDDHSSHLSELDGFSALHAWTQATQDSEALIFVELANEGDAAVLLEGAEADNAATVELVGFALKDGAGVYEPIGAAVPIEPGRELHLEPDGLALRLTGVDGPLVEGTHFEMHLVTNLGELEIDVEVEASDATAHGHAGHNH